MIFESINGLNEELRYRERNYTLRDDVWRIVCTSCPGDPLHEGHIECLNTCARYAKNTFIVIVNSDEFLIRKKGYCLLPLKTRMAVINNLKCEPWVVPWDDGTQNVAGALKIIKPQLFCKGGDRIAETMDKEELKTCEEIGCKIIYGVGGFDKKASSSDFVKRAMEQIRNRMIFDNPQISKNDAINIHNYIGCKSTVECQGCKYRIMCDSSGKADTKDEKNRIYYVSGPCVCLTKYCPDCKSKYTQEFINCITYNNQSNLH